MNKINFFVDNTGLYRWLFIVFFLFIPIINYWVFAANSLYVLTTIFLGIGYYSKPKWFHIIFTFIIVLQRSIIVHDIDRPATFIIRLFVYLVVTVISVEVIKQFKIQKNNKTEIIMAISKLLDSRDAYTANHSENVAKYSLMIARAMGMSKTDCKAIYLGGLLHDTGKIGVPESILTKPSKLTNDEYEIIKNHPLIGYESLKHVYSIKTTGILDMVRFHHERYDGKGYPYGLKGKDIPLTARIMAIADSFDAMTSKRVYNDARSIEFAMSEIVSNKGAQFDPDIADVFLNIIKNKSMPEIKQNFFHKFEKIG
ncbi:HD-GYP domain-containing protein [Bacillus sp. DNRA2]|uniref:HD-GYP domain-containing protein n=1 Tax=Bacillus sp. DNRA2 TaxID=2723053 RepID=UPI001B7D0ABD|nr:HD-GYP domain-containing protein [Bacillus sp. DNRA2]